MTVAGTHPIDVVLVNPGDRRLVYQDLGIDLAAVEPLYRATAIASHLRRAGQRVAILDASAMNYFSEPTLFTFREA